MGDSMMNITRRTTLVSLVKVLIVIGFTIVVIDLFLEPRLTRRVSHPSLSTENVARNGMGRYIPNSGERKVPQIPDNIQNNVSGDTKPTVKKVKKSARVPFDKGGNKKKNDTNIKVDYVSSKVVKKIEPIDVPFSDQCNSSSDCIPDETIFNSPKKSLLFLGFPFKNNFISLSKTNVQDFVFVTAANKPYWPVARDAIALVQRHFPDRKIIFYDLDVQPKAQTKSEVESCCNVEYREFPFSKFPDHVSVLKFYAWKPLIIHMVLQEYAGVFWIDSSIRFSSGDLSQMFDFVIQSDGVMTLNLIGSSIFPYTSKKVYHYIPTNISKLQPITQIGANIMLLYRTKSLYDDVIKWWALCALTKNCIAPTKDLHCGKYKGPTVHLNCHRYDQSVINVLLANAFDFDGKRYSKQLKHSHFKVTRGSRGQEQVQLCPT